MTTHTWSLIEECGGEHALRALLTDFYDRLYDDLFVGFFFLPHDKTQLIQHQFTYLTNHLGRRPAKGSIAPYEGKPMATAHQHIPILAGHFDRRHVILKDTLLTHDVPEHVRIAWLELDQSLRPLILNRGKQAAHALNTSEEA